MENYLTSKATIQIQKPKSEVFNAIIDAEQMNKYFIEHSTGSLETGVTVNWKFPEFEDIFPVTGKTIIKDEFISFDWSEGAEGMIVEISLSSFDNHSTIVRIEEKQMPANEEGIKWLMQQTEGWANFLACLKASLEYNINLRKGAFDFMKKD